MMFTYVVAIAWESWSVLGQMAPYLLFGFLVAGILSVCISPEFVERHLGGRGFAPVVKAAMFGVPLPLCSCGVIPVAASFRRHGASPAATTSFLLSTPQTGVDSIAATYALLGMTFAIYRPIIALITGLLGGLLVMLFSQSNGAAENHQASNSHACTDRCCTSRGARNIVLRALEYAFIVLPRDVGFTLLIGVVIAGAIGAFVEPNELHPYLGGGILSIILMMAIGTPLYVCATASVPIAAALMAKGASPGAALAFLIAGPATNAATIVTVWKLLGRRTVFCYFFTIALSAILGGLTLDWLMSAMENTANTAMQSYAHHHAMAADDSWISTGWSLLLLAILAVSYFRKPSETSDLIMPHSDANSDSGSNAHGDASQPEALLKLAITGMTCSHCAAAVKRALGECAGVTAVQVDLAAGLASITGQNLDPAQLLDAVNQLGYTAKIA
jgi:uncharacterized membrane protein YraQ (UPF0718 family)/copper chaperone CopZ